MSYCPMAFSHTDIEQKYCLEDPCAWWDPSNKQCVLRSLSSRLQGAREELAFIGGCLRKEIEDNS